MVRKSGDQKRRVICCSCRFPWKHLCLSMRFSLCTVRRIFGRNANAVAARILCVVKRAVGCDDQGVA